MQKLLLRILSKVYVEQLLCSDKRAEFRVQNSLLNLLDASGNLGVLVEAALECLIDTLVHPVLVLAVAVGGVVAVGLNVVEVLLNALPYLLQACLCH